jgi:uncharacterized protein (DUF934 family)
MPLIKDGKLVEDHFVRVLDDGPVADAAPVLIPAERFLADAAEYAAIGVPVGVLWPNNKRVSELAPHLDRLALIALHFPAFKDGRAYSQARILRERYRYRGELRATGDILQDQFLFLLRAGFNAFYQPTGDGRATALRARLKKFHDAPFEAAEQERVS